MTPRKPPTGGGRGTNQYGIKGRSVRRDAPWRRHGERAEAPPDVPLAPPVLQAAPFNDLELLESAEIRLKNRGADAAVGRYIARRSMFVHSLAAMEGSTFTLPEVRTLIEDGEIPEGKTLDEVDQVRDLRDATKSLADRVQNGTFAMSWDTADQLNNIIARHEVIEAGVRRWTSRINADGRGAEIEVAGQVFQGYRKPQLEQVDKQLMTRIRHIEHPVLRAVNLAAAMSYAQMYFDGNKRTSRLMGDGVLLSHGFDGIAIPAVQRDDYQAALVDMFRGANLTPYAGFLLEVLHQGD